MIQELFGQTLTTAIAAPALAQEPAPRAHTVRMQQDQARVHHRDNEGRYHDYQLPLPIRLVSCYTPGQGRPPWRLEDNQLREMAGAENRPRPYDGTTPFSRLHFLPVPTVR
jgi:hypothetical protein